MPAAVAGWVTCLLLLPRTGSDCAVAVVVGLGVAAGAVFWRRRTLSLAPGAVLVAALAVSVAAAACFPRVQNLHGEPWRRWIDNRTLVVVRLQIRAPPTTIAGRDLWSTSSLRTRVTGVALEATEAGRSYSLRSPVVVSIAGAAPLHTGQTIRLTARVREARPGFAASLVATQPPTLLSDDPAAGDKVRDRLSRALAAEPADRRALVSGMALGDDADMAQGTSQLMKDAGLSHLTAVSGANMAIVAGAFALALRAFGASARIVGIVGGVAICGYVLVVGPEPSVLRAGVMAAVALVAAILGVGSAAASLSTSVLVLLSLDPVLALSRGFALSCAATLGLIVVAGPGHLVARAFAARLPLFTRPIVIGVVGLVSATTAAQVATTPLLVAFGLGVSTVSLAANVVAAPFVPIVTIFGLGIAAVAMVSVAAAAVIAPAAAIPAAAILHVAQFSTESAGARVVATPTPIVVATAVVVAAMLLYSARRRPPVGLAVATAMAVISLVLAQLPRVWPGDVPADWVAIFCDVGQGDATLLRSGPESAVAIDVGPDVKKFRSCLRRSRVSHLDGIVLTHFHRDHVGALSAALSGQRNVPVLVSPLTEPRETYADVMRSLHAGGLTPRVPGFGEVDRVGWASWRVLWPAQVLRAGSAPNNTSVALAASVDWGGRRTNLFLGADAEVEAQARIIDANPGVHFDVAKVPHHGSRRQHPRLAEWAHAGIAVVSVGRGNDYGHPAAATLRSWQRSGARVMRTDEGGDVVIAADPESGGELQVLR